jgi:hypothetical protein
MWEIGLKYLWNIISKQHKCDEKIKMMKIFKEENKMKELEGLHHHTLSNMFIFNFYHVLALTRAFCLYMISFPNLFIIFPCFFHNASNVAWTTASFNCMPPSMCVHKSFNCRHLLMCVHTSHQPYWYPPLMLHPW